MAKDFVLEEDEIIVKLYEEIIGKILENLVVAIHLQINAFASKQLALLIFH